MNLAPVPTLDELARDPGRAADLPRSVATGLTIKALSVVAALASVGGSEPQAWVQSRPAQTEEQYLDHTAVAELLGVSKSWVEHNLEEMPPRRRFGNRQRWLRSEIVTWQFSHARPAVGAAGEPASVARAPRSMRMQGGSQCAAPGSDQAPTLEQLSSDQRCAGIVLEMLRSTARTYFSAAKVRYGRPGYVYFLRAAGTGLIKIGSTARLSERLVALRCASPVALELLHVIPSNFAHKLEMRFHRRYAALRQHGEWFRLGDEERREFLQFGYALLDDEGARCWGARAPFQVKRVKETGQTILLPESEMFGPRFLEFRL